MSSQPDPPARRTQSQRSAATRAKLADATISCLLELGYANTNLNEICRRAGLSRGAQQHHFATKAELMAHAIEHLTRQLAEQLTRQAVALPAAQRNSSQAIDLLWQGFSGPLSVAAMELWVAARTDPELHAALDPVDRALGRETARSYARFLTPGSGTTGPGTDDRGTTGRDIEHRAAQDRGTTGRDTEHRAADERATKAEAHREDALYWLTVHLTRGLALDAMIGGDPARREELLRTWKQITTDLLEQPGA